MNYCPKVFLEPLIRARSNSLSARNGRVRKLMERSGRMPAAAYAKAIRDAGISVRRLYRPRVSFSSSASRAPAFLTWISMSGAALE